MKVTLGRFQDENKAAMLSSGARDIQSNPALSNEFTTVEYHIPWVSQMH